MSKSSVRSHLDQIFELSNKIDSMLRNLPNIADVSDVSDELSIAIVHLINAKVYIREEAKEHEV